MGHRGNHPGLRGQRLEAIVHSIEAIDDGHRFRLAYLRKHWDTQMHHGDTFALDVARKRYFRPGTEILGSPEFSELLKLYMDRVYDANIASDAKTNASAAPSGATTATGKAAGRARYSRNARYEVGGYITLPSWHPLRGVPDSVNTSNRREPPSDPAASYDAFRRVRRTTKTPTYVIADAAAKAPWSELTQGSIEALYGTDEWGAKMLDLLTT
eukprot:jgi/Tetstr1/447781/TSEL_035111.t1